MRKSLLPVIVVALVATAMASVTTPTRAATAARYTVQDLGTLPGDFSSTAMGINATGDVVGWSAGPTGTRAFLYTNATGMKALAGPSGRPVTTARAVMETARWLAMRRQVAVTSAMPSAGRPGCRSISARSE